MISSPGVGLGASKEMVAPFAATTGPDVEGGCSCKCQDRARLAAKRIAASLIDAVVSYKDAQTSSTRV
jgi:hypothetical protein